jgi:iron only hydrogenase large subunit-like protein
LGGQESSLRAEDSIAIGGLDDVVRIFDDVEGGRIKDVQYIECHSCPTACVGGSLNVENPYIARARVLRMVSKFGSKPCQDREHIRQLYQKNFFSLPGKIPASPVQPLDQDVSKAIQKMRRKQQIYDSLPKIDCGACGSPTCLTFAEDVVTGVVDADDCMFTALKRFESISQDLVKTVQKHSQKTRTVSGAKKE